MSKQKAPTYGLPELSWVVSSHATATSAENEKPSTSAATTEKASMASWWVFTSTVEPCNLASAACSAACCATLTRSPRPMSLALLNWNVSCRCAMAI